MPSLSDRLKSLGVKIGAADLPPPHIRPASDSLDQVLAGHTHPTSQGDTYIVEHRYPVGQAFGRSTLQMTSPLDVLAHWARDERLQNLPAQAFAFIDTETTGLSGGTGTYAFLVGVGRFEADEFHLVQFFMRDPFEEPAQLAALEEFIASCQALVSYNGKAFDVPLLNARFISHGWRSPLNDYAHIDLLHLARKLWRDRLPSRTLGNIEAHILGASRTEEDVPGWMIPQMYFDYLRSGDPGPLRSVFYHNAVDVTSLAALLNHTAGLIANPTGFEIEHGVDLVALARLYEDLGDLDQAIQLYTHALHHLEGQGDDETQVIYLGAIERLAAIYKRAGNTDQACLLWSAGAERSHIPSHIELAKFYEHTTRDLQLANRYTQAAIDIVSSPGFDPYLREIWLADLDHRSKRIQRKLSASKGSNT